MLAALPLIGIRVGPGSNSSLPPGIPAMQGLTILQHASNRDSLDPTTIIVDTHRADGARAAAPAVRTLDRLLHADREVVQRLARRPATRPAAISGSTSSAATTRRARRRRPSPTGSAAR